MIDAHEVLQILVSLIVLILTGFSAVLWFMLQGSRSTAEAAVAKVAAHELYCARTYVTQEGLTQAIKNLEKTIGSLVQAVKDNMDETRRGFGEIYSKVDGKQDK